MVMLGLYLLAVVAACSATQAEWPTTDESADKSIEDYDCSTDGRCDVIDDSLKKKKQFLNAVRV